MSSTVETGPAVRIRFFERSREADRVSMDEHDGRIASLEVAIGGIQGTQGEYQGAVETLVSDVSRLGESREELGKMIKLLMDEWCIGFPCIILLQGRNHDYPGLRQDLAILRRRV